MGGGPRMLRARICLGGWAPGKSMPAVVGRGPMPLGSTLGAGSRRSCDRTGGVRRGRRLVCCASRFRVVSDQGGFAPLPPPVGGQSCPPTTPRKRPCSGQRAGRYVRSWAAAPSCWTPNTGGARRRGSRSCERGTAWAAVGVLREKVRVVSDLGGGPHSGSRSASWRPPSPPAGGFARKGAPSSRSRYARELSPENPSQTALRLAAGASNRAVVGRGLKLLNSEPGAVGPEFVRRGRRGSRLPRCWT